MRREPGRPASISHEKLFLLEGEAGIRVITGSANFSERTFSGPQNESYVCFDDDTAAWEHFGSAYERIVFRSEDIHGTVAKLRRDVPDYLYAAALKS